MTSTPFRRGPKIGPNDPCPCGNGRKFKKCHGNRAYALPNLLQAAAAQKLVAEEADRMLAQHKARELQRKEQQGFGRPIISVEHNGGRFVAVGSKAWTGKWKTFYDFLNDYIKKTLGEDWGNAELKKPLQERHRLFHWYEKLAKLQHRHKGPAGEIYNMPKTGAASAYTRLAYNLYLIAHNTTDIQTKLIHRLKDPNNFQGAFFETQVAAWLINAGFELQYEDESDTSTTHCEFNATYTPTGDKYSVEAKSRHILPGGHAPTNMPIARQLRKALEKAATYKRIVFIDLHKPLHDKAHADRVFDKAEKLLQRAHKLTLKTGEAAPPAYICLTNISDVYALDDTEIGIAVSFRGYKINDFMGAQFPTIRAAVRARERHWPLFQLLKSIEAHRHIPATFDGKLPSEAFAKNQPPRLSIGETYLVPGPGGAEIPGVLTAATVSDGKAVCAFHDPKTDKAWIANVPLTLEELADYEKHSDTYFGIYHRQGRKVKSPIELFDFFFDSYKDTARERLLVLLKGAEDFDDLKDLPQRDLAEIYSERSAYAAIAQGFKPSPSEN